MYSIFDELGVSAGKLTADDYRQNHPELAFRDAVFVDMPEWEVRINRQEGLFLDGENLTRVLDNLIDRYYFEHAQFEIDPRWCDVNWEDLKDDEPWLVQPIEGFESQHVAVS